MTKLPPNMIATEKLEQIGIIAARIEKYMSLEILSPMFFDDLQELLKLIRELRDSNNGLKEQQTIGNA